MAGAKDFSAVNTKISGMGKNLLNTSDYNHIMSLSQKEILNFLMEKGFVKATDFQDLDYLSVHLKRILIEKMEALSNFMANDYKILMDLIIDRYKIDDVKKAIRNIYNGNTGFNKENFVIEEDFYNSVNSGVNISDFIKTLSKERYYDYIRNYSDKVGSEILFYLEMSLDRFHYSDIYKYCEKLDRKSKKKAKELFGTIIDLKNVTWIYRAKKYYDVDDTLIYNYSIFRGLKFGIGDLLKMSKMDFDSFMNFIKNTEYSVKFFGDGDKDIDMSLTNDIFLYSKFKDYFKSMEFNMGKVLGYILIYEFQIKDIMVIMQGKEMKMNKESIKDYLICYEERRF